ncbi:MAG: UDP-N-acetylmuramoyl-tripeptide--D-alanyl-D-alanine ligase [Aerococcus sp.]|nr:UDP-N-acetylmuramoyl-tripeptide--D-alanyl-D-alanine ligase [Aerococcus sp.]
MRPLTIKEIVRCVRAIDYPSMQRDETIDSVAFDSREIPTGGLFVPLKGERDGHEFVTDAIHHGAKATFWANDPNDAPRDIIVIQVDDTLQALQDLAHYYLNLIQPKVVGITGSAGKTTTKDMTAAALSATFHVYKTQGNYNNEIGLPMTILTMPEDTKVLVLEMGMSDFGEIDTLSRLATPDVAVITMIGESHIEYLVSRANIAKAKLEILNGLKENGTFIYPGDEPLLSEQLGEDLPFTAIRVGLDEGEDVYAMSINITPEKTTFYTSMAPEVEMAIPVAGLHNVRNALVACAVAYTLGLSMEIIKEALAGFHLSANRMEWVAGMDHSSILNDTYNANPSAMKSVITTFTQMPESDMHSRRILVLGDMLELGDYSEELHASVSETIDAESISQVYLLGTEIVALRDALLKKNFPAEHIHYYSSDKDQLITDLKEDLHPDDQILVKASHGMGLIDVVNALRLQ